MSSSRTIDFSLRQNKAIERAIVFDGLSECQSLLGPDPVYVGLGSVWFQDFRLARRVLGVSTMYSIEADDQIYRRAEFNRPYADIEVLNGWTEDVLPELLARPELEGRPWIVWLDYDSTLKPQYLDELIDLIGSLAEGSVVLTTFSARAETYNRDIRQRTQSLQRIFGKQILPNGLSNAALKDRGLMQTLADLVLDSLSAAAVSAGRAGAFVPAFRILYKDSANMVTVGGILPSAQNASACKALVQSSDWCGMERQVLAAQPLTLLEISALSRLLPAPGGLSSGVVAPLGFELDGKQLDLFERHYLRYPSFVEIA